MKRFFVHGFVCFCFCFGFNQIAAAQTAFDEKLYRALLDLPAPPFKRDLTNAPSKTRSEDFFLWKNAPPDDAPLADLFDYWVRRANDAWQIGAHKPSPAVLRRLMEAGREQPEKLRQFIAFLPENAESAEYIKQILNQQPSDKPDADVRESANSWLKYHSSERADELLEAAQKIRDRKDGNIQSETELGALAKVDWAAAKPILDRLANDSGQIRSQILAKRLMYEHAMRASDQSETEKLRNELKAAVENRNLPARARDTAMDALFLNDDWNGREDWYVSLLADETLFKLEDESGSFTGLTTPLLAAPEKWTPTMIKLIGNQNRTIHNAAARNLAAGFARGEPSVAALRALLPWLANPQWATDVKTEHTAYPSGERAAFIEALAQADLPESVPGLIQVLLGENGQTQRAALVALAKYKDPSAVPALKIALEKEVSEYNRSPYIKAIIASGGLTEDEQVAALEAFAADLNVKIAAYTERIAAAKKANAAANMQMLMAVATSHNSGEDRRPASVAVTIGNYLSEQSEQSDAVILRALERIDELEKTDSALAQTLNRIVRKWQNRLVDAALLRSIKNGKATVETVLTILARGEKVRERTNGEFYSLLGGVGAPNGIAAVLTGDEAEMSRVFGQPDAAAQIAVLATARLVRANLPVGEIGTLLKDKNPLLALAAERYLEANDSPAARELILAKYPDQAKILGARASFNPTDQKGFVSEALFELFQNVSGTYLNDDFEAMRNAEDRLKQEVLENKNLKDVYAFLLDADRGHLVVRVYDDKTTLTVYDDPARYVERELNSKELEALLSNYRTNAVAEAVPTVKMCGGHHGYVACFQQSFVALNRAGGRRIFVQTDQIEATALGELVKTFNQLAAVKGTIRYKLADKIPALAVVLADEQHRVKGVWKNGDDLRVLIEKAEDEEAESSDETFETGDSENEEELTEAQEAEARRREQQLEFQGEQQRKYKNLSWRKIENEQLGEAIAQPMSAAFLPDATKVPETVGFSFSEPAWQVRAGKDEIRTGDEETRGLWRLSRMRAPVQIRQGKYGALVVTPDGKWAIANKETDESENHALVRVNLQTGKETVINLPKAADKDFYPIAFVAAHNKVLIACSSRQGNHNLPEYYLLNPETNATDAVKGEFSLLEGADYRPLQSVKAQPNLFWAAMPNYKTDSTEFGLYDTQTFAFKPLIKLPEIKFKSIDTWVDETEKTLYFVYEGQLLKLPLPVEMK